MERIDFIMTTTEAHFLLSDRLLGLVLGISSLLKSLYKETCLMGIQVFPYQWLSFLLLVLNDWLNTSNAWPVSAIC